MSGSSTLWVIKFASPRLASPRLASLLGVCATLLTITSARAASSPLLCDETPDWDAGCSGAYCAFGPGDVVVHQEVAYQCKNWPEGDWCVHHGYEPGSWAGQQAWQPLGPCEDPLDDEQVIYEVRNVPLMTCQAGGCATSTLPVFSNLERDDPSRQLLHNALEQEELMAPVLEQQGYAQEDQAATLECIEYARTLAAQGLGNSEIEVYVQLPESPFDFRRYQESAISAGYSSEEAQDAAYDAERQSANIESQRMATEAIEALGGKVVGRSHALNALDVTIRADAVADLCEADVVAVECGLDLPESADFVSGLELRRSLELPDNGYRNSSGLFDHSGAQGHRGGDAPVEIAVIEGGGQNLNVGHFAFRDPATGDSRFRRSRECRKYPFPAGYDCQDGGRGSSGNHASRVAGIALGSIESGQDPAWTSTLDRRHRSGIASRATGSYFRTRKHREAAEAFRYAGLTDRSDVINGSFVLEKRSEFCRLPSLDGERGLVSRATKAGALIVAAAGNTGKWQGSCTVNPPATYPDTLSVGALDVGEAGVVDRLAGYSSRGLRNFVISGWRLAPAYMVDVVVAGSIGRMPMGGLSAYDDIGGGGTSRAAPAVAGVAAIIKDALRDWLQFGGSSDEHPRSFWADPYTVRTLLSAMGDGMTQEGILSRTTSLDRDTGFGRVRVVDLFTGDPADKLVWWADSIEVEEGQVYRYDLIGDTGALNFDADGWKFAALVDKDRYNDSPDIEFRLIDTCVWPEFRTVVRQRSERSALKWRLRVREDEAKAWLRRDSCAKLEVRVNAGRGRLYLASILYAGDRSRFEAYDPIE